MGKSLRKDFIMVTLIAGVVATVVRTVVSAVPFYFGVTKTMGPIILAEIMLQMEEIPLKLSYLLLGEFGHILFGSLLAVGLGLIYLKWGTDYYLIKGAVYGLTAWLILREVISPLVTPGPLEPLNLATAVVSLTSHAVYGMLTGYIIVKYGDFLEGGPTGKPGN